MKNRFISATFLQFMGTVGSGIFVLPYLFHRSNLLFACIFLIFLTLVTAILNQFYVDIIINTKGDHQLAGYADIYLGSKFRFLATLNLLLLSFGAVATYTKLFLSFLHLLFPLLLPGIGPLIFMAALTFIYLYRHRLDHNLFLAIPIFMLLIPVILFIASFNIPTPSFTSMPLGIGFYGAALFALSSFTIIPEVQEIFGASNSHLIKKLSRAVLFGLLLAVLSYFLFIYSVVSISGLNLSVDSVTGLATALPFLSKLIALFGMVVTLRAAFGFLVILRELFYRDLKIIRPVSDLLPILFPIMALTMGSISLVTIISLTGEYTIFISALLICLIRLKISSTFITQFFCLLVIVSLSLGLIFNLFI